jgi:hypothetical protein
MDTCVIPPYNDTALPRIQSGAAETGTLGQSRIGRLAIFNEYTKAIQERDRIVRVMVDRFKSDEINIEKNTATILTKYDVVRSLFPEVTNLESDRGKYVVRMTVYYPEAITLGFDAPCETATANVPIRDGYARSGLYLNRRSTHFVETLNPYWILSLVHSDLYRFDESKETFIRVQKTDTLHPSTPKLPAVNITIFHAPRGGVFARKGEWAPREQYVHWFRRGLVPICGTFLKVPMTGTSVLFAPTEAVGTFVSRRVKGKMMTEEQLAEKIRSKASEIVQGQKRFVLDAKGMPRGSRKYRITSELLANISPQKIADESSRARAPMDSQIVVDACLRSTRNVLFEAFTKYVPTKRNMSAPNVFATHIANSIYEYKHGGKRKRLMAYSMQRESSSATNKQVYEHEIETIFFVTLIWIGLIVDHVCPVYYDTRTKKELALSVTIRPKEYVVDVTLTPAKLENVRLPPSFWDAYREFVLEEKKTGRSVVKE